MTTKTNSLTAAESRCRKIAGFSAFSAALLGLTALTSPAFAVPPHAIDGSCPSPGCSYSGLGTSLTYAFAGGVLLIDSNAGTITQGFTLTGSANNAINQDGNTANFSGALSDKTSGGQISIANTGTANTGGITFSGANTYTGATTVKVGADLYLSGSGTISSSSKLVNDGTFDISGTSSGATVHNLTGANTGNVQLGGSTLTVVTTTNGTFAGAVTDVVSGTSQAGSLTVNGTATETLSGAVTYTGTTSVGPSTTLKLTGSATLGGALADNGDFNYAGLASGLSVSTLSGSGTVTEGANTLTITNGSSAFSGAINSTGGGLAVNGGTQTLNGVNGYTGATAIGGSGTLEIGTGGDISASSGVAVAGTLNVTNTSGATINNLTGGGTVTLGQTLTVNDTGTKTFSGNFGNGGSGGFDLNSGNQTLSGTVNYGGTTTIASGSTLKMTGGVTLGGALADGGTFNVANANNDITVSDLSGSGTVTLGGTNLTVSAPTSSFSGAINSTGGGLTVGGSGTLTLNGVNGYTGATNISNGGTLEIGTGGDISASSGVAVAGTLNVTNTSGATINNLTGGGTVTLGQTLTVNDTGTKTFSGNFGNGGSGGFDLNSGNQTLSGTVNYGGTTTIASGSTLKMTGGVTLDGALADGGTFDVSKANNDISVSQISGSGGVSLGGNTLTITGTSLNYTGVISSTGGGLTVGSGATFNVNNGLNSYTGATTIDSGATLATLAGSLNSSSNVVNNGTLDDTNGNHLAIHNLTGTDTSASIALGSNGADIIDTGVAKSYAGSITGGAGGLTLDSGTQKVGNVSLSGQLTVDAGARLVLNGTSSLGVVDANGILDVSGTTNAGGVVTLGSLVSESGAGGIIMGGRHIVIADGIGTFSGSLAFDNNSTGTVELQSGTQTFSGTNYYKGGTTIDSGATLILTGSLQSGVTINNGGTLSGNGTVGNLSFPSSNVINHGTLSPNDPMTIFGNYTNASDGLLTINIGGTDPSLIGGLVINGTANLGGTLDLEFTNGFTPVIGESFTILTFTGFTGDFSLLTDGGSACTLSGTDTWVCDIGGTDTVVSEIFTGGPNGSLAVEVDAVPEPASILLSLSGIAALGCLRRRRSKPSTGDQS